jgi:hypothetical protein
MPRGSKPGERRGGRKKGTPNKLTQDVMAKLEALGCDPIEGMARIALGEARCFVCVDGQVTRAQFLELSGLRAPANWAEKPTDEVDAESTEMVTCPRCGGSGEAMVDTKQRGEMFKELAQYVAPKRKAVEHSGGIDLNHLTDDELDREIAALTGKK